MSFAPAFIIRGPRHLLKTYYEVGSQAGTAANQMFPSSKEQCSAMRGTPEAASPKETLQTSLERAETMPPSRDRQLDQTSSTRPPTPTYSM